MKAMVIGASGLVGGHLLRVLTELGYQTMGTCYKNPVPNLIRLDICNEKDVRASIEHFCAEVIFLPASLTNVDYCELHPDESFAINVLGVRNVVATGAYIVYFSSDYVFAGNAGPYRENDPVCPLNIYGQHKVLGEQSLLSNALIIRTTAVYGWEKQGKNFIYRLRNILGRGQELYVPVDQVSSPTYAPDLAKAAVILAEKRAQGVYNVVGPNRASRYELATEAAQIFGLNTDLVKAVATVDLNQPAPRPLNAGLLPNKAQAKLPFTLVDYHEGLKLFRDLLNSISDVSEKKND